MSVHVEARTVAVPAGQGRVNAPAAARVARVACARCGRVVCGHPDPVWSGVVPGSAAA
ncbi:hypothetical protein TPR58_22315 [Sphingomonas sp. HF-S3]|uniref:Uncharacterized protein n=1 Tax=Sphingomonas rustica TaxID=3103142 RepID=A0ABV0BEE0_9SPHN